jgi:hypothetical protein
MAARGRARRRFTPGISSELKKYGNSKDAWVAPFNVT